MTKVYIASKSWYENVAYGDYDEREIIGVFDAPCKAARCIVEEMETDGFFEYGTVMDKVISDLDEEQFFVIETDYEYVHYAITEYEVQ